jgi:hypothetical protein
MPRRGATTPNTESFDVGTIHCALASLGGSTSSRLCVWGLVIMIFDSVIMIFGSVIKIFDSVIMIFEPSIKKFDPAIVMIFDPSSP